MKRLLLNPEVRDIWGTGDEPTLLAAYERVWERKTILRCLYESWYRAILVELRPGNLVELGAGTGNLKRWLQAQGRRSFTFDILPGKFVDARADALRLPLRADSVDNIVLIDVLHHLARPLAFLREAARVLKPAGRVVMVEPFVSGWGWLVYKFFHHERVDFGFQETDTPKEAWDGNAVIPQWTLAQPLPLTVVKTGYREFLSYPLSGGFTYRCLLPPPILMGLHSMEQSRLFRNRLLALRIFAVLEKPS